MHNPLYCICKKSLHGDCIHGVAFNHLGLSSHIMAPSDLRDKRPNNSHMQWEWEPTVHANLAVVVIVGGWDEGLCLGFGQRASPGDEPLQEEPKWGETGIKQMCCEPSWCMFYFYRWEIHSNNGHWTDHHFFLLIMMYVVIPWWHLLCTNMQSSRPTDD